MSTASAAIIGTGLCMPEQVRFNDDPIFKQVAGYNQTLFTGYDQRRVLGPGESVVSIMAGAAQLALQKAKVATSAVDLLIGYASVSQYITPNQLALVHAELGLPPTTPVIPIADDFTNFNTSLLVVDAMIRAGQIQTALIACGANWTSYVDYSTPQCISAGDGAGAAVVAAPTGPNQFFIVDRERLVASADYGAMYMAADPVAGSAPPAYTSPFMHITAAGGKDFVSFGGQAAAGTVVRLMQRNNLKASDVTLITHQASQTLLTLWENVWTPVFGQLNIMNTLTQYANIELAAIPVNFATFLPQITTEYVVFLGLGVQLHASALLLKHT